MNIAVNQNLLRPVQAASYLGLSMSTLAKMRMRGDGPPFLKLSRRVVVYRLADLNAWLESSIRVSTTG